MTALSALAPGSSPQATKLAEIRDREAEDRKLAELEREKVAQEAQQMKAVLEATQERFAEAEKKALQAAEEAERQKVRAELERDERGRLRDQIERDLEARCKKNSSGSTGNGPSEPTAPGGK